MANSIIDERLKAYASETIEDEAHALKEILQEIILYGISNAGFFDEAIFHGGSSLRILYGLPRFSEDLDFLLKAPNPEFEWEPFMRVIVETCNEFSIKPEVTDKSRADKTVQKMFLKDDSIGKILDLSFRHHPGKKLTIKLEIDTNPPAGSQVDIKFLEFPLDFSIIAQDLSSSFAGKCHALLCREYIKGRDWYDFLWYVSKKVTPNFTFLTNAMDQQGPWKDKKNSVTENWFAKEMENKIHAIDWQKAVTDVEPFLKTNDRKTLKLWSPDFFIDKLRKLELLLKQS